MKNKVILISSNKFGEGDDSLGEGLLKTFCSLLSQNKDLPAAIFCMNSGVFTLTEESSSSEPLIQLEKANVPIYACQTCLEHYDLTNKIALGQVSTMLKFIELSSKYEVITIN